MRKSDKTSSHDITTERYKGPSVASAAAGEGFLAHFAMGITGLIAGGVAAFFLPKQAIKLEEAVNKFHLDNKDHTKWFISAPAKIAGWAISGVEYITSHTPAKAKNWLENKIGHADRFKATVFGAGTASAFGYFVFPLLLGPQGARKGIAGKQQFKRAQEEIIKLRGEKDELRDRLEKTETALEDAKTANAVKRGLIKMSADEAPASSHAEQLGAKPESSWVGDIAAQKEAQASAENAR